MSLVIIVLVLFPLLFLFNTRLALVALGAAIVWMVVHRTTTPKRPKPRGPEEPRYKAGYED